MEEYIRKFEEGPSIPYAYLRATCEKYPKVEYISERLRKYLNINEESSDWHDYVSTNILFMIPFDERDNFRRLLERAMLSEDPIVAEHGIISGDGSISYVSGWVFCSDESNGERHFTFLYLPSKETRDTPRYNSYMNALKSAYNIIFEINLAIGTVECIHGKDTTRIGSMYDIHMTIPSAKTFWLNNYIVPEDRSMMREFFDWITTPGAILEEERPLQAEFSMTWTNGELYRMLGVAVQLDANTILFCCRDITDVKFVSPTILKHGIPVSGAYARTFGHFDLFVNNVPITFSSAKEKELLALLVDRNGGTLTSDEAIAILWEDELPDERVKARYRKLAMSLKNTLDKNGVSDIIINDNGTRSINTNILHCDYYDLLEGSESAKKSFHNAYMSDYSWAEDTLASLWDYS